jgi:hypothetical protein
LPAAYAGASSCACRIAGDQVAAELLLDQTGEADAAAARRHVLRHLLVGRRYRKRDWSLFIWPSCGVASRMPLQHHLQEHRLELLRGGLQALFRILLELAAQVLGRFDVEGSARRSALDVRHGRPIR